VVVGDTYNAGAGGGVVVYPEEEKKITERVFVGATVPVARVVGDP